MINNSININKVNNHLSPKESLNSDDQQFRGQVVVHFVDIDRVVDHHCLNFL
jgi:hypothetical protein